MPGPAWGRRAEVVLDTGATAGTGSERAASYRAGEEVLVPGRSVKVMRYVK